MPITGTTSGYNPSLTTPSLASLVSASVGVTHTATQEYTVAMGWLAVLQRAAAHMQATPRLRKDGVLLARAIAEATGAISARTAGSAVTIPATVMARLLRSSAKHLGASSRLHATTLVKHVNRPLYLLSDSLVVDPKSVSLNAKAGVAETETKNLSADTVVDGEEFVPLGVLTVVSDEDLSLSLSAEAAVLRAGVGLTLDAEAAVEAETPLSLSVDAGVQVDDASEALDAKAAVKEEVTLSLGSKAAVKVINQMTSLVCQSAVQAAAQSSVQVAAAVARIRRAELVAGTFVVYGSFGTTELDADAAIARIRRAELESDVFVEDIPSPPTEFASSLPANVYIILRGQLDATTYVVPIPRATWVNALTAVEAPDTAKGIGADTFIVT